MTALEEAIGGFETCWVNQSWLPESVKGDMEFAAGNFKTFLKERSIVFRNVPPNRYSRNPVESKQGLIRSIFPKPKSDDADASPELLACRAVAILNSLHGKHIMSSFKLAKGYTKQVNSATVKAISDKTMMLKKSCRKNANSR